MAGVSMTYKNFIWDFDGTLFDTYPVMLNTLAQALAEFGVAGLDRAALYQSMKLKSVRFVEQQMASKYGFSAEALAKRYHELEHASQREPQPYTGAKEVLQAVVAQHGQNFLDTHRNQSVYQYLQAAGLRGYFVGGVDADQDFPRKPDPGAILAIMAQYQLAPNETVIIGDRRLDIEAGTNAGIATIYFNVDRLNDAPMATHQIQQLTDVLKFIS